MVSYHLILIALLFSFIRFSTEDLIIDKTNYQNFTTLIPAWISPCVSQAQPLFQWQELVPNRLVSTDCAITFFESNDIRVEEKFVFLSAYHCFYDGPLIIFYRLSLSCDEKSIDFYIFANLDHSSLISSRSEPKKVKRALPGGGSNGIRFETEIYSVNITEELEPPLRVITIHALNVDRLPLFYNLLASQDARSMQIFKIDRITGDINAVSRLDRESIGRHVLRVSAYEAGNPSRSAIASVIVRVIDTNDHKPIFEKSVYVATISENTDVGTTVLHVHAQDNDEGANGEVAYTLESGHDDRSGGEFAIDSKSGVLKTRRLLDRERKDFYRLKVNACDKSTSPACSTALVEISIDDENDNYPQFDRSKYQVDVKEDADSSLKPVIAKITAADKDAGENGKIHYSVVSGNGANKFAIDYETGEVRLLGKLNYKQNSQYELVVRAQDGGRLSMSNTTLLVITVVDINDHAPQFYHPSTSAVIREDANVGAFVTNVQAYDGDSGENAAIKYRLILDPDDEAKATFPFELNESTGTITVKSNLDRETVPLYDFHVVATDGGHPPLSSSVRVLIHVSDVNDNAPRFERKIYNISVLENSAHGAQILRLSAYDPDEASSRLDYSISAGNEDKKFLLVNQGDSGQLTINGKLDYKQRSVYSLSVKATDSGGQHDTATVYVYVEDVNSPPFFNEHPFVVRVYENEPIGSTVAVVQASDDDDGRFASLSYEMDGDQGGGYFRIDPQTGVISVNRTLDRETYPRFDLRIVATDGGRPPLSASTQLEVVLEDVNDNAPQFQHQNYTAVISEDTPVGTSFFQVSATDADDGMNSRILYFIGQRDSLGSTSIDNGTFYIDASSGIIRVQKPLDRERISDYFLPVLAVDKGVPSLTGSCLVRISITDVNDNAPRFLDAGADDTLRFYVPENSPVGTRVARILASDPDVGANAKVSYKIFGGTDMASFDLSSTLDNGGVDLLTRTQLDYESKKNSYQLQLQATSGDLSTVVDVDVRVLDVNDHAPILNDFYVIFNNYEGQFPLNQPGRVPAYDPDVNDTLSYHVVESDESDLLSVDERSGRLTLGVNSNANRRVDASLKICVSDGANEACAMCRLRTVSVTEEMLLNSVTLRIKDTNIHSFLNPIVYNRFIDSLATLLPSNRNDIFLFSVKNGGAEILNISFSIRKPGRDQFVSSGELQEMTYLNQGLLKLASHFDILPFEDNLCVREPCLNFERCQNVLKFGEAPDFISTDTFLFRPVHPVNTFVCVCPDGFAGMNAQYMCDTEVNLCYSSPCGVNGTCVPKEGGYVCICPPDSTGPQCEFPLTTDFCLPGLCRGGSNCEIADGQLTCKNCQYPPDFATKFCQLTARTFTKRSYLTLPPLKSRNRFRIKFSFATMDPDGLLFYNGRYHPQGDFIALRLVNGKLLFEFSIGDEKIVQTRFDENSISLADGNWHNAMIAYHNRTVTLTYDDCDEAIALHSSSSQIDYPRCAAKSSYELEEKCSNPTVSCFRFLDLTGPFYVGGLPNDGDRRRFRIDTENFQGCIRDLVLDEQLIDFDRVVLDSGTEVGCRKLSNLCSQKPCKKIDNQSHCRNVWGGYVCDCGDKAGGQNCSDDLVQPRRLLSPESGLEFELPTNFPFPFATGLSFRTHDKDATVLLIEFTNRRRIALKLINGQPVVEHGGDKFSLSYRSYLSDGNWHTFAIAAAENHLNASVDYVYSETFLMSEPFYGGLKKISIGSSEKGDHNNDFLGCIKGVFMSRSVRNPNYLSIEMERNTEIGCRSSESCNPNPCPANSVCVQNWDSYACRCSPGYVGGQKLCVDACSLNPCLNGGRCRRTNITYQCICPPKFSGRRCETVRPLAGELCPKNWWGFPLCAPCKCPVSKGYESDCDKKTGDCKCKAFHYQPLDSDRCFPCDCYYPTGATNASCDYRTGQCPCRGDVIGRRCDLCSNRNAQIDRSLGRCQAIVGSCPESFDQGILWPRTPYGVVVHRPCPKELDGVASRKCNTQIDLWSAADLFNCSSMNFEPLRMALTKLDTDLELTSYLSKRIASELRNATDHNVDRLYGRDLYVAYRLILTILRRELYQPSTDLSHYSHILEKRFVENLIQTSNVILSPRYSSWWTEMTSPDGGQDSIGLLVQRLHDYGVLLARNHANGNVRPFQIATENIFFAVDSATRRSQSSGLTLPKSDNFIANDLNSFGVHIYFPPPNSGSEAYGFVFYSAFNSLPALMNARVTDKARKWRSSSSINSPIISLSLFGATGKPLRSFPRRFSLTFPLLDHRNRSDPQCVWWDQKENNRGSWQKSGCSVITANRTHVTCGCTHLSTFAVLVEDRHLQRYATDFYSWLSNYINIAITVLSVLLLIIISSHSCCFRENCFRHSNSRSIVKSIAMNFCLVEIAFVFVHRANEHEIPCKIVAATLQFAYVALFTWSFLYLVHLYRMVTEVKDVDREASWIYCLLGWGLPLVSVGLTASFNIQSWRHFDMCWFDINDPFLWTMAGPIALILLMSLYISALCAIIGYAKEWRALASKFNFRDQLATSLISQCLFVIHSLLALAVVNFHVVVFNYCYDVITMISTGVLLYMIIRHRSSPVQSSSVAQSRRRNQWACSCCRKRDKSLNDEEESSKFGKYATEDPSATVSRPDSPVQSVATRSSFNDRGRLLSQNQARDLVDDTDNDQHEDRLLGNYCTTPNMGNFSKNIAAQHFSPQPRIRLNSFNGPIQTLDDFRTASGCSSPQSVISDILTLRRPIKPDLIPTWESTATTAGGYATIRKPLIRGRNNPVQTSILSPAQKVLSDSEGEESPAIRTHQRDRFQTFVSPVGYAIVPTASGRHIERIDSNGYRV